MKIMRGRKAFVWKIVAALIVLALCVVPVVATTAYAWDRGSSSGGDRNYGGDGDRDWGNTSRWASPEEDSPAVLPTTNMPSITTDATDYAATQTPVITVSNLAPDTETTVTITAPDGTVTDVAVTTDENGNATVVYAPAGGLLKGDYSVTATDGTTTITAAFTDAVQYKTEQWANVTKDWRTGDLNAQNSHYNECDTVPFLLTVTDAVVSGVTYTITIVYDYSRNDIGEYDELRSYNNSEGDVTKPVGGTWNINGPFTYKNTTLSYTGPTAPAGTTQQTRSYTLTLDPTASTCYVLWGGHLAKAGTDKPYGSGDWAYGASSISGAPLHMNTDPGGDRSINNSAIYTSGGGSAFQLSKEGPEYAHVGDTITYTYYVYNGTYNQYQGSGLNDIRISDDKVGTFDFNDITHNEIITGYDHNTNKFSYGDTWAFTATYVVLASDNDPLVNTATLQTQGCCGWHNEATDTWSVDILHPSISVTKTGDVYAHHGDIIDYEITVENTGDTPLDPVSLTETIGTGLSYVSGDDGNGVLDVDETWTYTSTYTVSGSHADPNETNPADILATNEIVNTATATFIDHLLSTGNATATDEDDASTEILHPGITVDKSGDAYAHHGDTIHYSITVYNNGDTPLDPSSVTDDIGTGPNYFSGDDGNGVLDIGETWTYTSTYAVSGSHADPNETNPADILATNEIVNTATATFIDHLLSTGNATATDEDDATTEILHPGISITKTGPATANVGDTINFTFVVDNIGDTDLDIVKWLDGLSVNLVSLTGDDGNDGVLGVNEIWTLTVSYVVQAGDAPSLTNTVDVSAFDPLDLQVFADSLWTLSITVPEPEPEPEPGPEPEPEPETAAFEASACPETLFIDLMGTVAGFPVKTDCTLCVNVAMTSPDGSFTLNIPAGTQVLNSDGTYAYTNPNPDILGTSAGTPAPPAGATIVSAYQLSPDGIIFNNHMATLAAQYDPAKVPQGSSLIWAYYDDNAGQWVDMDTAGYVAAGVEVPNTLATTTAHFTYFAILAK